jgi:diguanylate cyclase (GGDEF)-like protein/PAS domain S-box-containing protein
MKPISSVPLDAHFRYRIINDEVVFDSVSGDPQRLLGFDAQAFRAGTVDLRACIHVDDSDIAARLFAPQAAATRQLVNLRLRQANGRIRCVKCSYEKSATTTVVTLDLLLEDAKSLPRTLSDAALTANFRAMMENTDDYIYFKDRNHVFTGASQTLVSLCDPVEHWTDLIGQTDYDVFPEAYADIYYKLEKQVFAGVEIAHEVQEYLSKEGRKGWVDNRKYPIRNATGEIIGLYGIARDITEQRRIEVTLLNIANFVAHDHGKEIFEAIAEFSAQHFGVDYVHIALLEPSQTEVRVVAARLDGKRLEPGYVYALTGTPCEQVMQRSHQCYTHHVQQLFPADRDLVELKAESYLGEPIVDNSGRVLGLIVLVSRRPMTDSEDIVYGLRILAARAAADQTQLLSDQALRASEHLLSTVIDEMPDVLLLKDEKGDFLLCNQTVAQLYNTTPESMVGKHDGDFGVPQEMAEFFRENVLAIMARGETEVILENSRDAATGEVRHFKSIKKPFKDAEGNNRILVIAHDITDVVRAQEQVAASEKLLRDILDIAQEGIWDWHVPSGRVAHNARWYQTLNFQEGCLPETVEGFTELLHPDDRPKVQAQLEQLLQGKIEFYQSDHRLRGGDGRYRWVRDRGRVVERDDEGRPLRVVGSFFDNTPQYEAEQALRQERETLRLIVDHAPIGIWLQDGEGKLSFVNRAFCDAMGIPEERFLAVPHYIELMPEAFRPQCLASDANSLASEGISITQQQLPFVDGKVHDLRVIKAVKRDVDGKPLALVGLSLDITEELQREQALKASEEAQRTLIAALPDVIMRFDPEGRHLFVSENVREVTGLPAAAFIGKTHHELGFPEPMCTIWDSAIQQPFLTGRPHEIEFELDGPSGHVAFNWRLTPDADSGGRVHTVLAVARDITERKRAEAALLESEARHRVLFESAGDAIMTLAPPSWRFASGNSAAISIFGARDEADFTSRAPWQYSPDKQPDGRPSNDKAREMIEMALHEGSHLFEWMHQRLNGETFPATVLLSRFELGGQTLLQANVRDITERKQAEEALRLAANVFTHAREGITITDREANILEVNAAFTGITGYSREEVLGQNPRILKSGKQGKAFYTAMWHGLQTQGYWTGEVWNKRKDGTAFAEMMTISAVRDERGDIQNYIALFSDITPLKEQQARLEHIAHFDALTGLPNRLLLADRLGQAMRQATRRGQRLAVAYLDLDGFKVVNDTYNHEVGDRLLIALAKRMSEALREGDTLARIGGDEFVAVLVDLPNSEIGSLALERLLEAAASPVQLGDLALQVSASIGVSIYPQTEEVDADQLVRQADQAMYQAKQSGKNRFHLFDAEHDRSVRGRHESLEHIREALANREFVLFYQPKVNMRSGQMFGAEALIRWQHPERGLLSPAVFLPVIENDPLAIKLGEWVIDTALAQIAAWRAAGMPIPVSVNVGALQLQHPDFVSSLRTLLARHRGVQPGDLELEILETSALQDFVVVSQVMATCRDMGVTFAVDDFGTGYSSLTYLKQLPAAVLKIDQSFVRDMLDDPDDLAILKGVLGLAEAFSRRVIAEGVETPAHGEMLLQLGCELAQGYAIARPMPAQDLPRWAMTWAKPPNWQT